MSQADKSYDAFISYSRKADEQLARQLGPALERFAKPWYRMRRLRVFRDDSSLSASPDLWRSIEHALARSRWMILMASPEATRSPWVEREVSWWLDHHDGLADHILVAVTEPGTTPGEFDQLLPTPLRGQYAAEPRWIDISDLRESPAGRGVRERRRFRHRLREAVADFSSTILELPKEELYGQVVRQYRTTISVVSGAAIVLALALVASAVATVIAVEQRDVADQQKRVAISRQLVVDGLALATSDPRLARQLLAAAYQVEQTTPAADALLASPGIARVLGVPGGRVRDLEYGPDGSWLALASDDGVRLYDADSGRLVSTLTGFDGYVSTLAVSSDGALLAAGDQGGNLHLWNIDQPAQPQLRAVRRGSGGIVGSVAFEIDGPLLAVIEAGQTIRLIDTSVPAAPKLMSVVEGAHQSSDAKLALTPDGNLMVVSDEEFRVRILDITDRSRPRLRSRLVGHRSDVESVAVSPGGNLVATSSHDGTVRMWDITDPDHPLDRAVLNGHDTAVIHAVFSPDGTQLASTDWRGGVKLWNISDPVRPSLLLTLSGNAELVNATSFHPDGRTLATGGPDGTVRLLDISNPGGSVPFALGTASYRSAAAFTADGTLLASGFGLSLADVSRPGAVTAATTAVLLGRAVRSVSFRGKSRIAAVAAGGDNVAQLWDFNDPTHPQQIGSVFDAGAIDHVVFSPDGNRLLTAGEGRPVSIWIADDPAHIREPYSLGSGVDEVHRLTTSADGETAFIFRKAAVEMWSIVDPTRPVKRVEVSAVDVMMLAASATIDSLTAVGSDGVIRRRYLGGPAAPAGVEIIGRVGKLGAAVFSADGKAVFVGTGTKISVWRIDEDGTLTGPTTLDPRGADIENLIISADGRRLASVDVNSRLSIWNLDVRDLLSQICRLSGEKITAAEWVQHVTAREYEPPCAMS